MEPIEEFKESFAALSDNEQALIRSLFTGEDLEEALAALEEEDELTPSCEMGCESCGCHGDFYACEDYDYGEDE